MLSAFCAVFLRSHSVPVFEISVKAAQRGVSAAERTLKNGYVSVFKKRAGTVQSVLIEILDKRYSRGFFKIT